jgi:hypothetical protein
LRETKLSCFAQFASRKIYNNANPCHRQKKMLSSKLAPQEKKKFNVVVKAKKADPFQQKK